MALRQFHINLSKLKFKLFKFKYFKPLIQCLDPVEEKLALPDKRLD